MKEQQQQLNEPTPVAAARARRPFLICNVGRIIWGFCFTLHSSCLSSLPAMTPDEWYQGIDRWPQRMTRKEMAKKESIHNAALVFNSSVFPNQSINQSTQESRSLSTHWFTPDTSDMRCSEGYTEHDFLLSQKKKKEKKAQSCSTAVLYAMAAA